MVHPTTRAIYLEIDGSLVKANLPFGFIETGGTPTHYTYFQGGTQAGDITYTWPNDNGDANQVIGTTDGAGLLDWVTAYISGGTDVPLVDGGTGASLVAPAADAIMFYDFSLSTTAYLTPNTLISIDGTNLNVDSDLHNFSWTNVVDSDITNTLTSSIFINGASTTNAVDLATSEVNGILPLANGGTGADTSSYTGLIGIISGSPVALTYNSY